MIVVKVIGETTAGISGGSQDAKTGSKRGWKIIDSPSMRTRKDCLKYQQRQGKGKDRDPVFVLVVACYC